MSAERRRTIEWSIILAAVGAAIAADLLQEGPGAGGVSVYLIAALPGLLTYLVWRSPLAAALVALAPMYFVIGIRTAGGPTFRPELAIDRAIPLQPVWMLAYGSLYVFVVILPLFVVRGRGVIRRAMQAYLLVMTLSYAIFLVYPTSMSRLDDVAGEGFGVWTLRVLYSLDPPYNCFPSLHVAYAFVSAFACFRVNRGVGAASIVWAGLIAVSTLFTKQHYVADVISGAAAAVLAYILFLRGSSRDDVSDADRERAPLRALAAAAVFALMIAGFAVAYHFDR